MAEHISRHTLAVVASFESTLNRRPSHLHSSLSPGVLVGVVISSDSGWLSRRELKQERSINVAKLLRAYGGCLGIR